MTYKDTVENRPTKDEVVSEIWFSNPHKAPTNLSSPTSIIDKLNEAIAKAADKYIKLWVVNNQSEDEYGNITLEGLIVYGTRYYTDKEWKKELISIKIRIEEEHQRHIQRDAYFSGAWIDLRKSVNNKIKELCCNPQKE